MQLISGRGHCGPSFISFGCGHARNRTARAVDRTVPLRVRRLARVRLHVDLTILAQLASALLATRTP